MNTKEYYTKERLPKGLTFDNYSNNIDYDALDMIEFADDYYNHKLATKLLKPEASDICHSIRNRYFIVGYRCRLNGAIAVGSINMETKSTYLNRVEATKVIYNNNIGAKDIVITSVSELNKVDYYEWMGF